MHSPLVERWLALASSSRPAVIDATGAVHTYAELGQGARVIASALREAPDGGRASLEGERIGLLVSPGAAFVEALFGVLLAGGAGVVLTPLYPTRERRYFCDDAHVRTLIASPGLAPLAAELSEGRRLLLTDEGLREGVRGLEPAPTSPTSPALQLYTSGTTGRPKGAVLSHENLATQQALVGRAWGFSPDDRLLHTLPLHHMHGLAIALLTALGSGACTRFLPFDAPRVWDAMADATVFMGVPSMYQRLQVAYDAADDETRARWSSAAKHLRLATSGSAALPTSLGEFFRARSGAYPLERFGMTEIGVGLTNPLEGERRPGCVGLPLPSVDTRVVDEAGLDAEVGELLIRGPSVFGGYFERPEENSAAFVAAPDGGAPWFRTGDTVTRVLDEAGAPVAFKILGRTSVDILKSGGYKLSALEIEEALREHPRVLDAAVVGLPDEAWGERVVACVLLREGPGHPPDAGELRAFCKERLAPYKVPKDVHVMATLPRNPLGKVVKPDLVRELSVREKSD
ncbi:MAG TPA: AMP-binding protein [Polyangiaceae bacterium]|nr:AMP-binding protein [Polyangiaceae bacterium]